MWEILIFFIPFFTFFVPLKFYNFLKFSIFFHLKIQQYCLLILIKLKNDGNYPKKIKILEHWVIVKGTTSVSKGTNNVRNDTKNMRNPHILRTLPHILHTMEIWQFFIFFEFFFTSKYNNIVYWYLIKLRNIWNYSQKNLKIKILKKLEIVRRMWGKVRRM